MSLNLNDETWSFEDEKIKSNIMKLIELKLELADLENLKNHRNFIKNSNLLESLKKLESYHEKKLQMFKNRILFFESYLINNLNKTKTATRMANSNRFLCEEISEQKETLQLEIQSLKERTNALKKKLDKYQKYYDFVQDTLTLFSTHQFTDLPQIVNRFKSLKLILDENQNMLNLSSDNLLSVKSELYNIIRNHSDSILNLYAKKSLTEQEFKKICQDASLKNETSTKNMQISVDRLEEFDLVLKSIDNLYKMSLDFSKLYNKDSLENLHGENDKKSFKQLIFDKLVILKENIMYLNELSK